MSPTESIRLMNCPKEHRLLGWAVISLLPQGKYTATLRVSEYDWAFATTFVSISSADNRVILLLKIFKNLASNFSAKILIIFYEKPIFSAKILIIW